LAFFGSVIFFAFNDSEMKKIVVLLITLWLGIEVSGQIIETPDGLYYDASGKNIQVYILSVMPTENKKCSGNQGWVKGWYYPDLL
jgi:hypothetical protein